jgi:hypothetical protein
VEHTARDASAGNGSRSGRRRHGRRRQPPN